MADSNPANLAALQKQLAKNPKAGASKKTVFLEPVIDFSRLKASNVKNTGNLQPFFDKSADSMSSVLVSDDEPQFAVKVIFTEQCEVTTVTLRANKKPQNSDNVFPPKEIWFIGDATAELDFDDLNDECELENYDKRKKFGFNIENPEVFAEHPEVTISMPPSRFKGITNMTVFVKSNANNEGEDDDSCTFLNNLRFVGKPSGNKDISAWEPCKS